MEDNGHYHYFPMDSAIIRYLPLTSGANGDSPCLHTKPVKRRQGECQKLETDDLYMEYAFETEMEVRDYECDIRA